MSSKPNRYFNLTLNIKPSGPQREFERLFVDRLKKAVAKFIIDFEEDANDRLC